MKTDKRVCVILLVAPVLLNGCEKKVRWRKTDLHYAAQYGSLDDVRRLITYGTAMNGVDDNGRTPLHLAAREGRATVVELLVRCGARIDTPDNQGRTPAMLAMAKDHRAVVEFLVGQGVTTDLHLASYLGDVARTKGLIGAGKDISVQDPDGRTPLHYAASQGPLGVARLLIEAGADLDTRTGRDGERRYDPGETPLHCAVVGGHVSVVELLIDSGADVDARNRDGMTPLFWAAEEGKVEMVKLLIAKGADADAGVRGNRLLYDLPLGAALRRCSIDIAESLVAGGADPNSRDELGRTLLHLAILHYAYLVENDTTIEQIIEFLIAHGADVNTRDDQGITALHCAAYSEFGRAAEILLAKGAQVNTKTVGDPLPEELLWKHALVFRALPESTPLHEAAISDDPNMVRLLLAHNADVDARDKFGSTPLHWAGVRADTETVSLLIAGGADVDATNQDGATPLVVALRNGNLEMARMLIAAGARKVVMKDHFRRMDVEYGQDWEPLFYRSLRIREETNPEEIVALDDPNPPNYRREWMELLVENGADVNERDEEGDTALHTAVAMGDEDSIRLFIAHGAEVDARNQTDDTPLHNAAFRGHKEVVGLLLAHGADATVKNSRGRTPLDEAVRRGHQEVIQVLKAKQGAKPGLPGESEK